MDTTFKIPEMIAFRDKVAKELDLEFAAGVTNVPYHPGAAQYFAEKGIEVPTK